jgi:carbamate kinase
MYEKLVVVALGGNAIKQPAEKGTTKSNLILPQPMKLKRIKNYNYGRTHE